jgi:protein disulfide-isomerase
MKYLYFIIVFCAINITAQAQEIFWHTDMQTAINKSIAEKKPIMLFFTGSDWCGWCHRLQAEVFNKPEFITWTNNKVIAVELDFPRRKALDTKIKQQNSELGRMLDVKGYPTIWFVQPVMDANKKVNLNPLGSKGYEAGGPVNWTTGADTYLQKAIYATAPVAVIKKAVPQKSKKKKKSKGKK